MPIPDLPDIPDLGGLAPEVALDPEIADVPAAPDVAPNEVEKEDSRSVFSDDGDPDWDEEDSLDEDEDEIDLESPSLTLGRKLLIALFTTISFCVFAVWMFPYEQMARYALSGISKSVQVSFDSLQLNLFGNDEINMLRVNAGDGLRIQARRIESSLSYLDLLGENPKGVIYFEGLELNLDGLVLKLPRANLEVDLKNVLQKQKQWTGVLKVNLNRPRFMTLPAKLSLLVPDLKPADVKIGSIKLALRINRGGRMRISSGSLSSNMAQLNLRGDATYVSSILAPNLNLTLCSKFRKNLKEKFPRLHGLLLMAGVTEAENRLCWFIKGSLNNPSFSAQKNAGTPSGSRDAPRPAPDPDATKKPSPSPRPDARTPRPGFSPTPGASRTPRPRPGRPIIRSGQPGTPPHLRRPGFGRTRPYPRTPGRGSVRRYKPGERR